MYQLSYTNKLQLIDAYDDMIIERLKTYKGYFVNFMFNEIRGGADARRQLMSGQVERFHSLLTRHIIRKPESAAWRSLRPVLIVAPDLPVPKIEKTSHRIRNANDGLHINGTLLMPPRYRASKSGQKQSRLETSVKTHVEQNQRIFLTESLARIHLTRIKYGTMTDYMFKTVKKGLVEWDDITIFT